MMAQQTKKSSKYTSLGLCLGLSIGLSLGLAIGKFAFDSMTIGMCVGLGCGMCFGAAFGALMDKKINAQIEEKGYIVKSITQIADSEDFTVIIVDKAGIEKGFIKSDKQIKAESLAEGVQVYLDEKGNLTRIEE